MKAPSIAVLAAAALLAACSRSEPAATAGASDPAPAAAPAAPTASAAAPAPAAAPGSQPTPQLLDRLARQEAAARPLHAAPLDAAARPEAIRRGARTLDGIKFRTRSQMGRCHGSFCTLKIMAIMAEELHIPYEAITKRGKGSELIKTYES